MSNSLFALNSNPKLFPAPPAAKKMFLEPSFPRLTHPLQVQVLRLLALAGVRFR